MAGQREIQVNVEALDKAAKQLDECRLALARELNRASGVMNDVVEAMESSAGVRLTERYNNLCEQYFDKYAMALQNHAAYLNQVCIDYQATDATLKEGAESALKHFDDV